MELENYKDNIDKINQHLLKEETHIIFNYVNYDITILYQLAKFSLLSVFKDNEKMKHIISNMDLKSTDQDDLSVIYYIRKYCNDEMFHFLIFKKYQLDVKNKKSNYYLDKRYRPYRNLVRPYLPISD